MQKGADSPEPSAPSVTSLHVSSISVQHVVQNIHMIQHRTGNSGHGPATITIVTHKAAESAVQAAIAMIEKHEMSAARAFVLRVEE